MHASKIYLLLFLLIPPAVLTAQATTGIGADFHAAPIHPDFLRDDTRRLSIDDVAAPAFQARFRRSANPYATFGNDPAQHWLRFEVENPDAAPRSLVLRLNRKNLDRFDLYGPGGRGGLIHLGAVGSFAQNEHPYILTDGYFIRLVAPPGRHYFYASAENRIGPLHFNLSLHTPEDFQLLLRRRMLLFGIFAGVMAVSLVSGLLLYFQYRDPVYLFYLLYVGNIMLREAYNFSADFGMLPVFQRYVNALLITATFGMFFRRFIRLGALHAGLDRLVRGFTFLVGTTGLLVWLLAGLDQADLLRYLMPAVELLNLLFTVGALLIVARFFRQSEYARIATIAYLPLAIGFVAILLRNLDLIPNFPLLNQAVLLGFIYEVLTFTFVFLYWHRNIEVDREMLQMKLRVEHQEKQLAIQAAEQKVKDSIARDLHDDVAASLSGIRILSQVAARQSESASPALLQLLHKINTSAGDTLESISDLIWAVKPRPDYLNDMADRMREHAAKVLEAAGMEYSFHIARDLPLRAMDVQTRRNIYLIFKEALNNALKYSGCRQVSVSLGLDGQTLVMAVRDDGAGFDPERAGNRGNGLSSMAHRAAEIGAALEVRSAPGKGTVVELKMERLD